MKYAFIHRHHQAFSVQRMCAILGVARSGYYAWRQRAGVPSPRRRQQAITDQRVAQAFQQGKGRSGAPRLTHDLNDTGVDICRNTVAASLRRQNGSLLTTEGQRGLPDVNALAGIPPDGSGG